MSFIQRQLILCDAILEFIYEYFLKCPSLVIAEFGRSASTTAVAEARHIKGDPLKGYYDFVITEGSYKFWAVFQVLIPPPIP